MPNNSRLPGRRGPRTVKTVVIDGVLTRVKNCGGPTCHGELRPVECFHKIKPPKQRVVEETISQDASCPYEYYSSQCKRCNSFRHRKRFPTGQWKGHHGLIPVIEIAPFMDELMHKCGNSTHEVKRLTGLDVSSIHNIRHEKYKNVRRENAAAIMNALLTVRRPSYKAPYNPNAGRLKPSARQQRLDAADRIDDRGELYSTALDVDVAA